VTDQAAYGLQNSTARLCAASGSVCCLWDGVYRPSTLRVVRCAENGAIDTPLRVLLFIDSDRRTAAPDTLLPKAASRLFSHRRRPESRQSAISPDCIRPIGLFHELYEGSHDGRQLSFTGKNEGDVDRRRYPVGEKVNERPQLDVRNAEVV